MSIVNLKGTTALNITGISSLSVLNGVISFTITSPAGNVSVNAQGSGVTSYTAVLGDANQLVTMSAASASTFTIPTNASVAFPVGTTLTVIQFGAGQITLTAAGGVTIDNPSSLTTRAQNSTVSVVQVSANVWVAGGDLT